METKKKRARISEVGQECWHCGTGVIKSIPKKKSRGRRAFYYEYCLKCPNLKCPAHAIYLVPEAKRFWSENSN